MCDFLSPLAPATPLPSSSSLFPIISYFLLNFSIFYFQAIYFLFCLCQYSGFLEEHEQVLNVYTTEDNDSSYPNNLWMPINPWAKVGHHELFSLATIDCL